MATVTEILNKKGSSVVAIEPAASAYEAAVRMNEHKIGSLVVLDEGRLVGIVSERDILMRVVAQRCDAVETLVQDVMTTEVIYCERDTSIDEARAIMRNCRVRHLPVLEDGKMVGLISIGDLNAYHLNHQELTIHLLNEYIAGHV